MVPQLWLLPEVLKMARQPLEILRKRGGEATLVQCDVGRQQKHRGDGKKND